MGDVWFLWSHSVEDVDHRFADHRLIGELANGRFALLIFLLLLAGVALGQHDFDRLKEGHVIAECLGLVQRAAQADCSGLPAGDARNAVRRPRPRVSGAGRRTQVRHLDYLKTAVDKVGRGKERDGNAHFGAMVSRFLFKAEFCTPASGWMQPRAGCMWPLSSTSPGVATCSSLQVHAKSR